MDIVVSGLGSRPEKMTRSCRYKRKRAGYQIKKSRVQSKSIQDSALM
jgi:hypothetical protein